MWNLFIVKMMTRFFCRKTLFKGVRCCNSRKSQLFGTLLLIVLGMYFLALSNDTPEHKVTRGYIERALRQAMEEDRGTGCVMPKLDAFSPEIMEFDKEASPINCKRKNWVNCKKGQCSVDTSILNEMSEISCYYEDIIYLADHDIQLGPAQVVQDEDVYQMNKSNFVKVRCKGKNKEGGWSNWKGHLASVRRLTRRMESEASSSRVHFNILMFGFDSTAKNGFIRKMPRSYKVLTEEMGSVVLENYNIVGDGTPQALFPIFTGYNELELPDIRKRVETPHYVDEIPFLWYLLEKNGYKTGYMEDMPWIGTFTYRFTGFRKQPTDLYNRALLVQASSDGGSEPYCISGIPTHQLLMDLTEEFMQDTSMKRFIFTFSAELSHDDFNNIGAADEDFARWLQKIRSQGLLNDTVLIVMGDHGPRYSNIRDTLQGKQEERLPLMSILLPESLKTAYPQAALNLAHNARVLTTPYDLHATLLHIAGLRERAVKVKVPDSELSRSMSLLDKIPSNRSCAEAAVEVHWCACLRWTPLARDDPTWQRVARVLLDYINKLTEGERVHCALRTLTSIEWVTEISPSSGLLSYIKNKDLDGYLGKFGARPKNVKVNYQIKMVVGPGKGIYEASLMHDWDTDILVTTEEAISRINAYGNEPQCVSSRRPDLNKYCYCKSTRHVASQAKARQEEV